MKLLYIKSNPKPDSDSKTLKVANHLVQYALSKGFEVVTRNLFNEGSTIEMDLDFFNMYKKVENEIELDPKSQEIWTKKIELANEFKSADYIVIAAPLWSGWIPGKLKDYLDVVAHPGITFIPSDDGTPIPNMNAKFTFIQASGGTFNSETNIGYLHIVKRFLPWLGLKDAGSILVQNTDTTPNWNDSNLNPYKEKAEEIINKLIESE